MEQDERSERVAKVISVHLEWNINVSDGALGQGMK